MHERLKPLIGVGLSFAGQNLGCEAYKRPVRPILDDGIGQQVQLCPVFVCDFPATLIEPIIDEFFGTALFDDDAVERPYFTSIRVIYLLQAGNCPAPAGNADNRRMGRLALSLRGVVSHVEINRLSIGSAVIRQHIIIET